MAKYAVKMSCGHEETIELFGKTADRDRKIAWLQEHGTCSACYKARLDAEKIAATKAAAEKAVEDNLPELTGSEKQINWAMTIRAQKLTDLDKMFGDLNAKITDEQMRSKNQIAYQAARNVLTSKTEAKYWIDNRNNSVKSLFASLKVEFDAEVERLTAEAEKVVEADVEDYVVSPEAQDVAIDAETKAAKDNVTKTTKAKKQLVYDWYGGKQKRATHTEGKKFYFVRWNYSDNCYTYYLAYTTSAEEDERIIADGRWERITRKFAMELVKRGGHLYGDNIPIWLDCAANDHCRDKKYGWYAICPYAVNKDMSYIIDKKQKLVVAVSQRIAEQNRQFWIA